MPPRSLVRTFLVLYVTLGIVIGVESVQTALTALHGGFSHQDRFHALLLGTLEACAAILFLIPRTMRQGAMILLVIFALAFGLHLIGGDANFNLLVFAAAVLFVRVHGVRGHRWSVAA